MTRYWLLTGIITPPFHSTVVFGRVPLMEKNSRKGNFTLQLSNPVTVLQLLHPCQELKLLAGDIRLKLSFQLKGQLRLGKSRVWGCLWTIRLAGRSISRERNNQQGNLVGIGNQHETGCKRERFFASWNAKDGGLTSLAYDGRETLAHPSDFSNQPIPQAFRAPVDNDRSFGNWLAKDWSANNLDTPIISTDSIRHFTRDDGAFVVEVIKTNQYKSGKIKTSLKYTVTAGGTVDLECHFIPSAIYLNCQGWGLHLPLTRTIQFWMVRPWPARRIIPTAKARHLLDCGKEKQANRQNGIPVHRIRGIKKKYVF